MTKTSSEQSSKGQQVVKLLVRTNGASIEDLMKATGWQQHSVRGFLSGTIKKKLGHELISEPDKNGVRRYRIIQTMAGADQ